MKIKIEKMDFKDGVAKTGRPYTKISIGYQGNWYSCFKGQWNSHWKTGDEIEVETQPRQYNGKTYYDIIAPNKSQSSGGGFSQASSSMAQDIADVKAMVSEILKKMETRNSSPSLPPAPDDEDLPF